MRANLEIKKQMDEQTYLKYLDKILDTDEHVRSEIYVITNTETGLQYVGKSRTHKENNGRLRPFGTTGRFETHKSSALNMTGDIRCLHNAIRKYGVDKFNIKMLERCEISVERIREKYWQNKLSTFHPNGYNIYGSGGKVDTSDVENVESTYSNPEWRSQKKSDTTREKIGDGLRNFLDAPEERENRMKQTQRQHLKTKLENFRDVVIPSTANLESLLRRSCDKDGKFKCYVFKKKVEDKRVIANFYGKYETEEEILKRALTFLKTLQQNQTQGNS